MPKATKLLRIGPFRAVDYTTADVDANPGDASAASNVDTERTTGAYQTARGRVNLGEVVATIGAIAPLNLTNGLTTEYVVINCPSVNALLRYNTSNDTYITYTDATTGYSYYGPFTTWAAFGDRLFLNVGADFASSVLGGKMIIGSEGNTYPVSSFTPTLIITLINSGAGNLLPATYYYTFTTLITYPDGSTAESGPSASGFPPYFTNIIISSPLEVTVTSTSPFGGAYGSVGATFSTNIYRQSTEQPTWYLVATVSSGTSYVDNSADATIAPNQQLLYRYPPPQTYGFYPIFSHKERLFYFVNFSDPVLTLGVTQCQLWYSDPGGPQSFYADTQVLLIGNDSDNLQAYSGSTPATNYTNDMPMAGLSLSSVAILIKRRSFWILYGDDPDTFVPRKMWNIGTISQLGPTVCEDVVCWPSEVGHYLTDGNSKKYIGEAVRNLVDTIPISDQRNSVGWYAGRTWYLSYPATGITLRYYIPKGTWLPPLGFGAPAAFSVTANQATVGTQRFNQIIASRGAFIDAWNAADGTDLGSPITSSWTSQLSDSGDPGTEKEYQWLVINAPIQTGVTATVTLTISGFGTTRTSTSTFNLADGPTLVATIGDPQGGITGFMAQVLIALTLPTGATTPGIVYSVELWGSTERELVASNIGVT